MHVGMCATPSTRTDLSAPAEWCHHADPIPVARLHRGGGAQGTGGTPGRGKSTRGRGSQRGRRAGACPGQGVQRMCAWLQAGAKTQLHVGRHLAPEAMWQSMLGGARGVSARHIVPGPRRCREREEYACQVAISGALEGTRCTLEPMAARSPPLPLHAS